MTIQNSVSPEPLPDEAVAITTALEMLWPKPQQDISTKVQTSWRFSGRSWTNSTIARRSRTS